MTPAQLTLLLEVADAVEAISDHLDYYMQARRIRSLVQRVRDERAGTTAEPVRQPS